MCYLVLDGLVDEVSVRPLPRRSLACGIPRVTVSQTSVPRGVSWLWSTSGSGIQQYLRTRPQVGLSTTMQYSQEAPGSTAPLPRLMYNAAKMFYRHSCDSWVGARPQARRASCELCACCLALGECRQHGRPPDRHRSSRGWTATPAQPVSQC
jgi:hypothetical protein